MRINVNEYNEILSYEGTPAELAEFVELGVFGEWVPADQVVLSDKYDEEDCGCENESTEEYVTTYTEPVEASETSSEETPCTPEEEFNINELKESCRKQMEEDGIKLSDEEFDFTFNVVTELMDIFKDNR